MFYSCKHNYLLTENNSKQSTNVITSSSSKVGKYKFQIVSLFLFAWFSPKLKRKKIPFCSLLFPPYLSLFFFFFSPPPFLPFFIPSFFLFGERVSFVPFCISCAQLLTLDFHQYLANIFFCDL